MAGLGGQVEKTASPIPEPQSQLPVKDSPQMVQPKGSQPNEQALEKGPTPTKTPSYQEAVEVAEKLQRRIDEVASAQHKVSIRKDERSQQFVIEIQDPDGKVVKQFPSEKVLNLHQRLDDLSGMVIDEMI